jgi:hypothetical protein
MDGNGDHAELEQCEASCKGRKALRDRPKIVRMMLEATMALNVRLHGASCAREAQPHCKLCDHWHGIVDGGCVFGDLWGRRKYDWIENKDGLLVSVRNIPRPSLLMSVISKKAFFSISLDHSRRR